MKRSGENYQVDRIQELETKGRAVLHDALGLTGSEISINELPAGVSVPFMHAHKRNEEVYIVLKGSGRFHIDGDEFEVGEGDVIRIDPSAERCITASADSSLRFICVQTEANSLVQFTAEDGVLLESKPSWFV